MKLEDIHIDLQSEFHMLRHFVGINPELKVKLLHSGISEEAILKELNEPGSRFFPEFANDIASLINRILIDGYDENTGSNGNLVWTAEVDTKKFQNGVGTLSVIPVNRIPAERRSEIFFIKNRGVNLQHFKVEKLPSTASYTVILKPMLDGIIFITAFPGPPAMPLPDYSMDELIYEQCKAFWDEHVFLKL